MRRLPAILGALVGVASGGGVAWAQVCTDPGAPVDREPPAVLVVMDASRSMAEPLPDGTGTRLDAAKRALDVLVDGLPAGTRVGLRLYGHREAGADRATACRDTELVAPVAPLDARALKAQIGSYEAVGRTPIGRALRAGAQDLPAGSDGQLVLVSDGGDNCAPPDPCRVAAEIGGAGRAVTVQSVGFLVTPRAREQLECIARAGGGSYTDVSDPEQLGFALRAAAARSARTYRATGTRVTGGTAARPAPLAAGTSLDALGAGEERTYAVRVGAGQRIGVSAALVAPCADVGAAIAPSLALDVRGPGQARPSPDAATVRTALFTVPSSVATAGVLSDVAGAPGAPPPGRWLVRVALRDDPSGAFTRALRGARLPVELRVDALGSARPAGAAAASSTGDGGGSGPSVVVLALAGALAGLGLGALLGRVRRRA